MAQFAEHPQDVLGAWLSWRARQRAALVIVTGTEGGSVRAPGAMMAVSASGDIAGYISGGCIDRDVAEQAVRAIGAGKALHLRYGAGSPFVDLPLPCGGAIEVAILPDADPEILRWVYAELAARRPVHLAIGANGALSTDPGARAELSFRYIPKMRLRIAGRGADAVALARIAVEAGIETVLQLRAADLEAMGDIGAVSSVVSLGSPAQLPPVEDDPWTAFVLAFHDLDWDVPLLQQALAGPAFYIGAVGSRRTHETRCARLRGNGVSESRISRLRGPAGLVPALRDASMVAMSILAEVVAEWQERAAAPFASTALVLLAAGQSRRFADGDKLLAEYAGKRVLDYGAARLRHERVGRRLAVVAPGQTERARLLSDAGWTVLIVPEALQGQGVSLAAGIRAVMDDARIEAAMVLLGDMPELRDAHLHTLRQHLTPETPAVMSQIGAMPMAPAIFARSVFPLLAQMQGDMGARQLLGKLDGFGVVPIAPHQALDIDTMEDLDRIRTA